MGIDYRTIVGVEGPLVIMENVKFPTFGEIVNVNLADGSVRKGQILEVNKKKAGPALNTSFHSELQSYLSRRFCAIPVRTPDGMSRVSARFFCFGLSHRKSVAL